MVCASDTRGVQGSDRSPAEHALLKAFGAAIPARRKALGLTQEQLAEHAELHTNYISSTERGERNVSLQNISRIAAALEMAPSELVASIDHFPLGE